MFWTMALHGTTIGGEKVALGSLVDKINMNRVNMGIVIHEEFSESNEDIITLRNIKIMMILCTFMETIGNGFLPSENLNFKSGETEHHLHMGEGTLGFLFLKHKDKIIKSVNDAFRDENYKFEHVCKSVKHHIGDKYYGLLKDMLSWPKELDSDPCDGGKRYRNLVQRINIPKIITNPDDTETDTDDDGPNNNSLEDTKITTIFDQEPKEMLLESIPKYFKF
jgi:hypothetical protein